MIPNTTTNVFVNAGGPGFNARPAVLSTYSINVGDAVQFSSPPRNAEKDTTYYIRTIGLPFTNPYDGR